MAYEKHLPTIRLLSSTLVHMQTVDGAQTLFTVPTGYVFYPMFVVVRDPTGSLAGGTDFDFTNWRQTVDLSSMTTTGTDYMVISGVDVTKYTENAAAGTFKITPSTGATADVDATVDVFGFLI